MTTVPVPQAAIAYRVLIDRLPLTAALKTALCQQAAQVQAEAWADGFARGRRTQ